MELKEGDTVVAMVDGRPTRFAVRSGPSHGAIPIDWDTEEGVGYWTGRLHKGGLLECIEFSLERKE